MVKAEIIVDSREVRSGILHGLRKYDDLDVKVEYLPVGDYFIHGNYLVERKTATDLVGSMRRSRLWGELRKLVLMCEVSDLKPVFLIEGSLALVKKFTRWNEASVLGIINTIVFKYKIPCLFMPSLRWTVVELRRLALSCIEEKRKKRALIYIEKPKTLAEVQINMLASIPGVSDARAHDILSYFGTVANVAYSTIDGLTAVPGIGRKIATNIFKAFNTKYEGK